jgi:hypothetical protein
MAYAARGQGYLLADELRRAAGLSRGFSVIRL